MKCVFIKLLYFYLAKSSTFRHTDHRPSLVLQHLQRKHGMLTARAELLEIVLCHSHNVLGPREVCSLLCTSKATAACLSQHMQGQMQLRSSPRTMEQLQQFCQWLVRNGKLLQLLEFGPHLPQESK